MWRSSELNMMWDEGRGKLDEEEGDKGKGRLRKKWKKEANYL